MLLVDWTRPFERLVGTLLFFALIGFGILIGLSLGFFSRELKLGEGWWQIITAAMAIASAACVALYIEDRKDRREWRVPINKVRFAMHEFHRALTTLEQQVRWARKRWDRGVDVDFNSLTKFSNAAHEKAKAIPAEIEALPHKAVLKVREAKAHIASRFLFKINLAFEYLPREELDEITEEFADWGLVLSGMEEAKRIANELENDLSRFL